MITFAFRDARQSRIANALAALTANTEDLRPVLEQERAAIASDTWKVFDRTYEAVAADWLAAFPPAMSMPNLINKDPALLAMGIETALTNAQAEAISFIHTPGDMPLPDFLDQVRLAVGNDEATFTDLVTAAHRGWVLETSDMFPHPFDEVGVLLPVRMETLFDAPGTEFNDHESQWLLSIRVIPDDVSIQRPSRYLLSGEEAALQAFWLSIQQPGDFSDSWFDGDAATIAWNRLAERVGAQRAAFLAGQLMPEFEGQTVTFPDAAGYPNEEPPRQVGGLPEEILIYATYTADVPPDTDPQIGRLPQDEFKQIDPDLLTLEFPRNIADARTKWWVNWDSAVNAGLAGAFLLPGGLEPQFIESLFVYGIGSADPASHFAALAEAGDFTVARPGQPTNSVHGEATAGSEIDSLAWKLVAQRRLAQRLDPGLIVGSGSETAIRTSLFGDNETVPAFAPVGVRNDCRQSQRLATALWPALWGRYLRDLWNLGNDATWVGLWAMQNLWPEGPLMPVRVGDEPYGLLPVTALSQWEVEFQPDPALERGAAVEALLALGLSNLINKVGDLTAQAGNVVGKPSEIFLQILGQDAQTNLYGRRRFQLQDARWAPYGLSFDQRAEARNHARNFYGMTEELVPNEMEPPDYLIDGHWRVNRLPLVKPTRLLMKQFREDESREHLPLVEFLELIDHLHFTETPECYDLATIFSPNGGCLDLQYQIRSLPDSLLVRLLLHACQVREVWELMSLGTPEEQELLDRQHKEALRLAEWFDVAAWLRPDRDPDTGVSFVGIEFPEEELSRMERSFRATLDSAAHRIDPWVTGFAWQRLQRYGQSPRRLHRMGVYGWVDGPFDGSPGPTDAGLLHTPSSSQTLAALVLRDKYLSADRSGDQNEAGHNPWQMNITASKVRLADEIAEEVRMGFHIYEVLGRKVEQIVGNHTDIRTLRRHPDFAMRSERRDPNEVCNGLAAIGGLLSDSVVPPIALLPEQKAALELLRDALDTYADLLMTDGVMQLTNRQTDRAAESMDAAAGFSRSPSFEFIRTPPSGYYLESAVISTLPFVSIDDPTVGSHPLRLADPSVAAAVEQRIGHDWTWTVRNRQTHQVIGSVTLDELGLVPIDTVGLPAQLLADLTLTKLGAAGESVEAPREHGLMLELIAVLGGRPVIARDIVADQTQHAAIDSAIYDELLSREIRLRQACSQMITDLQSAATPAAQAVDLRRALAWGVIPMTRPEDRDALVAVLTGQSPPEGATGLPALCSQAAESLQKRLAANPDTPDSVTALARWIATFASPNARLSVLGQWAPGSLALHTDIKTSSSQPRLDEDWLAVVAATRSPLARLEALQLELNPPLTAWTSSPDDPWRTDPDSVIAKNLQLRVQGSTADLETPRFVAAYGSPIVWSNDAVAAGMIDAFSEAVPMPQRQTSAAFGFNAPASRPPQAILLAVPPVSRQEITNDLALQIIRETRLLAIARAGHLEQWDGARALLPTSWLQSSGPLRVRLERGPLFV